MSFRDRYPETQLDAQQGEPDDQPVYSRRSPGGERFPSMDSLNDYGGGRGIKVGTGVDHRRMQSNDSLDSGCGERGGNSSVRTRKGSSSVASDPLQFVQLRPATGLARAAEEALRKAEAAKVMRQSIDRGEEDWQGDGWKKNLSSWKQKRKSQSSSNLYSSVDAAEVLSECSRPLSGSGFSGGSASNYHRYPYDDHPVADDLDDNAFQAASSPDATMVDSSLPVHRIKSDSDFGSCSPKEEINNDADLDSEGCRSEEDGSYQQQLQQTYGAAPGETGDKWIVQTRPAAPVKSDTQQVSGKMRITLKPPADIDDNFGFSIKGGIDKCAPITVDSVTAGSPADHAGLAETDEVLEISNEVVSNRTRGYCMLLINNSLKKQARLELVVLRDATRVAQALADKKRSSLGSKPKSIVDVYADISAATSASQQPSVNSQEDITSSSTAATVFSATTRTEVSEQKSHAEDSSGTADGNSSGNADLSRNYPDEQPSAMQADGEVYTSFVQLRLSSSSNVDAVDSAADERPAGHSPGNSHSKGPRRNVQLGDDEDKPKQQTAGWARGHHEEKQQRQRESDQRTSRTQIDQASYETDVLSRQKEREAARERATKKLLDLKRRFSSEAPADAAGGHDLPNGSNSLRTADHDSQPTASLRGSEREGRTQRTSVNGNLASSKEEELRRKELELRLMEERLMQERERILQEQQRLREQQQQLAALQLAEQQQQLTALQLAEQQQRLLADDRPIQKTQAQVVATPPMSDVYRHYEAVQLPEQLGSRDLTPPRMTRKDVVDMSKKAAAASGEGSSKMTGNASTAKRSPTSNTAVARPGQQQQRQPQERQQVPQQRAQTLPRQPVAAGKQASVPQRQQHDQSRGAAWGQSGRPATTAANSSASRKGTSGAVPVAADGRAQRSKEDGIDAPLTKAKAATLDRPSSQSKPKAVDFDPNMPDVMSKEDVLRLMREKPRYVRKAEQLRAEQSLAADDSGGGRRGVGAVHPLRKAISGFDMRGTDMSDGSPNGGGWRLVEAGSDEVLNKSLDFRTSRALFEQQGRAADAYWKERQGQGSQQRNQGTAATSNGGGGVNKFSQGKSLTLDRATTKGGAWKSNTTPASKGSARVNTWLAASAQGGSGGGSVVPAQTEWRKELESVRRARQQQRTADDDGIGGGADAEDDDIGGAREKERRLREERHRELASIRQLARGNATGGSLTPDGDSDVGLGSSDRDDVQWRRHDEAQMSFESDQSSRNSQADYWPPPAQQHSHQGKPYGYEDNDRSQQHTFGQRPPALTTQSHIYQSSANESAKTRSNGNVPASVLRDQPAAGGDGHEEPLRERQQPADHRRQQLDENMQDDGGEDDDEGVLSVSAKQLCTYCNEELGRGAAMVIESLNMCYHVDCFRCWACRQPLSDGARGADVRVRDNRLHCKDCYESNNLGGTGFGTRSTPLVDDAFL